MKYYLKTGGNHEMKQNVTVTCYPNLKTCSYKNTAARNARTLQKSQEGPIFLMASTIRSDYDYSYSIQGECNG
ncbi:hypothetical protein [Citrobacter freundii]|uniref:hypothetical protein n=1 Tax=Citrobacter freundii TaxID=546 RepID=UPI004041962C